MPPPSNKPGVRLLPKPQWRELVAPYQAEEPTIGDFYGHYNGKWFWLICITCKTWVAVPRAPFAIRWGPDAPHRWILTRTRCISCGGRELTSQIAMPRDGGFDPFPVEQGWCARIDRGREIARRASAD